MRFRGRMALATLGLVLLGGLALRIATLFERVENEERVPPGSAARRNPLLAAGRFLAQRGIQSRSVDNLQALPSPGDILLLGEASSAISIRTAKELATWVRAGGHLILGVCDGQDWGTSVAGKSLMNGLDLSAECISKTDSDDESTKTLTTRVLFSEPSESLAVEIPWMWISDLAEGMDQARKVWVVQSLKREKGRVTLLGRTDVFSNGLIGSQDHAHLIERLVTLDGVPAGVWLVYELGDPDFLLLLWSAAWPGILAAAAALTLLVWRSSSRFGPILPGSATGSRRMMDHIEAVGAFLWKRRPESLIEAVREETLRAAVRRRPHLAKVDPARRREILAALGGVSPEVARKALDDTGPFTKDEFRQAVAALESMRRSL